ncbi:MAG: hypothetical protein SGJ11_10910 [Phycisphaerae bacterium]|nr:hypothetical protein [Phycisphaerae bacterium]
MLTTIQFVLLSVVAGTCALVLLGTWQLRQRNMHRWLGEHVRQTLRRRHPRPAETHVLICIADHFEPSWGDPSDEVADARVASWVRDYPRLLGSFRDSDGRPPRHTFFYPIDQYIPRHVDALAELCRAGFGEVEIHHHHDNDTAENLERTLRRFTALFAERHGLLGRRATGDVAYGFVHGNWALDNSRSDGRWCGVRNELDVLRRTGCYADFTLPSAPDATQTRTINSIYYGVGRPDRCRSHDTGVHVGTAPPPADGLMLIQGPLRLWWPKGRWIPRVENGCLQRSQPPTMDRLEQWLRASVRVPTRPDWLFVKLHTHGATEANRQVLLGDPMIAFHRDLAQRAANDPRFRFHYVTAREMFNLAKAAEANWPGPIISAFDFDVEPPRWVASTHSASIPDEAGHSSAISVLFGRSPSCGAVGTARTCVQAPEPATRDGIRFPKS